MRQFATFCDIPSPHRPPDARTADANAPNRGEMQDRIRSVWSFCRGASKSALHSPKTVPRKTAASSGYEALLRNQI